LCFVSVNGPRETYFVDEPRTKRLWCHIFVLNVHTTAEDDVKDRFYEELEGVFDKVPK
jgi:hypothetical protein